MTPQDWTPVRRAEDDELVGYLVPEGDGTATPVTLFGYPLAGPGDPASSAELLHRRGLAVLAEPWWLAEPEGEGYRVQILSATPDAVTVARADYGFVSHDSERSRLPVPTDALRPYVP